MYMDLYFFHYSAFLGFYNLLKKNFIFKDELGRTRGEKHSSESEVESWKSMAISATGGTVWPIVRIITL